MTIREKIEKKLDNYFGGPDYFEDGELDGIIDDIVQVFIDEMPPENTDHCCNGGDCADQARIDTWNAYRNNLLKKLKQEKVK